MELSTYPALMVPLSLRGRVYNTLWRSSERSVDLHQFSPKLVPEFCSREGLQVFLWDVFLAEILESCLLNPDLPTIRVELMSTCSLLRCERSDQPVTIKRREFTREQAEDFINATIRKLSEYTRP